MNKLFLSFVKKIHRFVLPSVALLACLMVPASLYAWGPSRQTFTTAAPANFITFNSITDNPAHGDERNFMQIKESTASNSTYSDSISLTPGKDYMVYMYYHNNAAANLNLVALGTYAKAQIPAVVASGSSNTKANGYIGATNASPAEVYDDITFTNTTAGDIALRLVPGSVKINNSGSTNGAVLSDNIITSGATLGYNSLNGSVPGCAQYSGYVTFLLRADQANFTITKQVRLAGTTAWSKSIDAKIGDKLDYQIEYKNIGTTHQTNVVLKDILPTGITYEAGSTLLKNASNPSPITLNDDLVSNIGINIGDYTPTSNAFVKFSATVSASEDKLSCGNNQLSNTVFAQTNNGSKDDKAVVVVQKACTTATTLPKTGPADRLGVIILAGSIVLLAGYFYNHRKLNNESKS